MADMYGTAATNQPFPSVGETPTSQESTTTENDNVYANRHVPKFLALQESSDSSVIQVVTDGSLLTAESLYSEQLDISNPILVLDSPSSIGMKVPQSVTVRKIANIIGNALPVSVIDVRHQEELEGWTMGDLVEYFEDPDRLNHVLERKEPTTTKRSRRAAAAQALQRQQEQTRPKVLNQISLEFSKTPLRKVVTSPQFVRDMDWIDHAWPDRSNAPTTQYYCLTSTAGCYTDFHIDFGGTSVWYHVLKGKKSFTLIAPTSTNLAIYEDWLCRSNQAELFLPDLITDKQTVLKLELLESQTLMIPTGWIHAVYTPVDSVVIGGNFLHGLDMQLQLEISHLETRTRVPGRFRFPHFHALQFHAGGMYLAKMKQNARVTARELEGLGFLIRALEGWWNLQADESLVVAAKYAAKSNQCDCVDEFLEQLKEERERYLAHGGAPLEKTPKLRLKLPPSNLRLKLSPPHAAVESHDDAKLPSPQTSSLRFKLSPPHVAAATAAAVQSPPRDDSKSPSQPTSSLRLKLSPPRAAAAPSSPRHDATKPLRIKLSPDPEFRITLPLTSVYPKKRKNIHREGLEEYIPGTLDDEWQPPGGKRTLLKKSGKVPTKQQSQKKRTKKTTTAKQRLMKRLR